MKNKKKLSQKEVSLYSRTGVLSSESRVEIQNMLLPTKNIINSGENINETA